MGGGKPQSKGQVASFRGSFRHSRELQAQDVLRTRVEGGGRAWIGFATESYNVEKDGETRRSTAFFSLSDGTTKIGSDISQDKHLHFDHLGDYIPKNLPYDLALRINKDGNVPQIQFNDDAVWHNFTPDKAAVKAGPWFPYLRLYAGDRLSDHRVNRPKPTNSAGKTASAKLGPAVQIVDGLRLQSVGAEAEEPADIRRICMVPSELAGWQIQLRVLALDLHSVVSRMHSKPVSHVTYEDSMCILRLTEELSAGQE